MSGFPGLPALTPGLADQLTGAWPPQPIHQWPPESLEGSSEPVHVLTELFHQVQDALRDALGRGMELRTFTRFASSLVTILGALEPKVEAALHDVDPARLPPAELDLFAALKDLDAVLRDIRDVLAPFLGVRPPRDIDVKEVSRRFEEARARGEVVRLEPGFMTRRG